MLAVSAHPHLPRTASSGRIIGKLDSSRGATEVAVGLRGHEEAYRDRALGPIHVYTSCRGRQHPRARRAYSLWPIWHRRHSSPFPRKSAPHAAPRLSHYEEGCSEAACRLNRGRGCLAGPHQPASSSSPPSPVTSRTLAFVTCQRCPTRSRSPVTITGLRASWAWIATE